MNDSTFYDVNDRVWNTEFEILCTIIDNWSRVRQLPFYQRGHISLRLIPFNRLDAEYKRCQAIGFPRTKSINLFQDIVFENILKLKICTILMGHETFDPKLWLKDHYEDLPFDNFDAFFEDFEYWAVDSYGNWLLSDVAIQPLESLLYELLAEEDDAKKLYWIDRILQVAHQRSDLSRLFVEGGSASLDEIFGKAEQPGVNVNWS